jgi:hypothetical protein
MIACYRDAIGWEIYLLSRSQELREFHCVGCGAHDSAPKTNIAKAALQAM